MLYAVAFSDRTEYNMRIIFAGGGTVGHISPSIAIAEELFKRNNTTEILFIGRESGQENEAIKRAGFDYKTINISGLERRITYKNIKNILTALKAVRSSKEILKSFKPDIVFGTGGYVSYPILKAAQKLKFKTVIHESNACIGLASKALLDGCDMLLTGFGIDVGIPPHVRVINTGNPVRDEFIYADRETSRKKLGINKNEILITSFGGSGGSKVLNETIIEVMKKYSLKKHSIRHIHASGRKYYRDIAKLEPILVNGRNGCVIKPYINDVATLISASDIAITRCGAMTLAELAVCATPAILIPSPNVTNDHQKKNAEFLCREGAAIMIREDELTTEILTNKINKLAESKKMRHEMSKRIYELSPQNARRIIADEILKLSEK